MRKLGFAVILVVSIGLSLSCASAPNLHRPLTSQEMNEFDIIGTVQIIIENAQTSTWDGSLTVANREDAYFRLLAEARRIHQRHDVDVRNISVISHNPRRTRANLSATGDVVIRTTATRVAGVADALEMAAEDVARNFTARARIAIVYISAVDRAITDFINGELEHILQMRGFVLVDRSELDRIRVEQAFGLSGEVDDNTATRIGHFAGASVVITGGVDGEGALRRLRLRALDTATAQVVGTASERF